MATIFNVTELTKVKSSLKQSVVLAAGKLRKKKKGYNVW
jgi:hypothetical protein